MDKKIKKTKKIKNYTSIDYLVEKYQQSKKVPSGQAQMSSKPKEVEPPLSPKEYVEIQEVVENEKIDKEVKPYIKVKKETIKLPPDLKKMGLQPTTSAKFTKYQNIKLPISDEKVLKGLKSPITSSLRWLATFSEYILKQAHLNLRKIHGRVVRIIS